MTEPVVKVIDVPCSPETAFRIFTDDMGKWWPRDKHSLSAMSGNSARQVTMEPKMGGALIEIAHDGEVHDWGSVSAYDPFDRLSLRWHVGGTPEEATDVDIVFAAEGDGTRVTLTHYGWEVFGEGAADARNGYNSGWVFVFETCFAKACGVEVA